MHRLIITSLLSLLLSPAITLAASQEQLLQELQNRWVILSYQSTDMEKKEKLAAFEVLSKETEQAVAQYPTSAGLLILKGTILTSWADAQGGTDGWALAERAKATLEQSISTNPKALEGLGYASLGRLYHQTPSWPLSFGSDKKAEALLKQALSMNPDGFESNYFYGYFLMEEKRYGEARTMLEKALKAPSRPGQTKVDDFRRDEVRKLLAKF